MSKKHCDIYLKNDVLLKEGGAKLWKSKGWKISLHDEYKSIHKGTICKTLLETESLSFSSQNPVCPRTASLPAGVMEGLQSSEVPPCWRKALLQELATALTRVLEKLDVAPQPGLVKRTTHKYLCFFFSSRADWLKIPKTK